MPSYFTPGSLHDNATHMPEPRQLGFAIHVQPLVCGSLGLFLSLPEMARGPRERPACRQE